MTILREPRIGREGDVLAGVQVQLEARVLPRSLVARVEDEFEFPCRTVERLDTVDELPLGFLLQRFAGDRVDVEVAAPGLEATRRR
jgi:hypothetical protein